MSDKSNIEWTDATWTIVQGCDPVSQGCVGCYVVPLLWRLMHNPNPKISGPLQGLIEKHVNLAGEEILRFTGKVALREDRLTWPLQWREPRTIFVPSHGDLFHKDVPDWFIDKVFAVMALCPQHMFQVLTKRAARVRDYLTRVRATMGGTPLGAYELIYNAMGRLGEEGLIERHPYRKILPNGMSWPLRNVWLGVSCERQEEADERIPLLLQTPAAIRFISAEPLLGPLDIRRYLRAREDAMAAADAAGAMDWPGCGQAMAASQAGLHWVIVGGESGQNARPMSIQWAREIRDQCVTANVSFFFKQWGEWAPAGLIPSETPGRFAFGDYEDDRSRMMEVARYPRQFTKFGARSVVKRVGKKAAGRLLDGREWNEMPRPRP